MFNLKACPKCSGDLIYGYDMDEKCHSCLQCGYVVYERRPVAVPSR
jgi:hypothetical protein